MQEFGFIVGASSACVFYHPDEHLICSVHGDDFTTVGPKSAPDNFVNKLKTKYELKEAARLGAGEEDSKEARVLNRIVRWTAEGLEYEADPRQAEKVIQELGLEGCKGVATPAVGHSFEEIRKDEPIDQSQMTNSRALAARCNHLSADRPECQFSAKEVCRFMSEPTKMSVEALKRIGKYLTKYPRLVYHYPFQDGVDGVDVYVDTGHAGCLRTRVSTSGGCVLVGSHLLKSWSSTQPVITLSSGEAELSGVVRGGAVGLGFLSLLADLGVILVLRLWTDSTASQGMCARQGLGKVRHLDVQELWVQQRIRNGDFALYKIAGEMNPGDLFTKGSLTAHRIQMLLSLLGCAYRTGRALSAPTLRRTTSSSQLPKVKWSDYADNAFDEQHSEDEVSDVLKRVGLPHAKRECYKPESKKEAYPEEKEAKDELVEEGVRLGREQRGRGGLPRRLRRREGKKK